MIIPKHYYKEVKVNEELLRKAKQVIMTYESDNQQIDNQELLDYIINDWIDLKDNLSMIGH